MITDWDELLCVFLHDPPDKALGVQDHEQRATRYLIPAAWDVDSLLSRLAYL